MEKHPEQENLEAILSTIDGCLGVQLDINDGQAIAERISVCASIIGTSASAVATADQIYNQRLNEVLPTLDVKYSATQIKLILTGLLHKESYWLKYAERQNAALVHALDGYRSMLSYLKEEMKMSGYGAGNINNR